MSKENDVNKINHFQYRDSEYFAKFLLEYFDSDRYSGLLVNDKPDLWCLKNDIGIEVVDAIDKKYKESESLWFKIPYVEKERQTKFKNVMFKNGYEYQGEVQCWGCNIYDKGANSKPYDIVYTALKDKLHTLNKGQYKRFLNYELFINSNIHIQKEWCKDFLENCKIINSEFNIKFTRIIVYSQIYLVVIDFDNDDYLYKEIQSDICNKISRKAFKEENIQK